MQVSVFVNSIKDKEFGGAIVEASNGNPNGPPFIRFELSHADALICTLSKRYILTIEEAKEN